MGFVRMSGAESTPDRATIAEEVPIAFVYRTRPHVVMMATPADLEDLAVGFTLSEQIVERADDITDIRIQHHQRGVELTIDIPQTVVAELAARARGITARTGCGLCGVEAIDDAVRKPSVVTSSLVIQRSALWRAAAGLDGHQPLNRDTHAIHAAAWATPEGEIRVAREDVGRHNALDKVLGALVRSKIDPREGFLIVTSRASFELVQKAAVFGVPLLAAVSRPTGLAIRMADLAGMCLAGLLRGETCNVYTHSERVA
jgi:formate dehydrogenase accessory protein FdhD